MRREIEQVSGDLGDRLVHSKKGSQGRPCRQFVRLGGFPLGLGLGERRACPQRPQRRIAAGIDQDLGNPSKTAGALDILGRLAQPVSRGGRPGELLADLLRKVGLGDRKSQLLDGEFGLCGADPGGAASAEVQALVDR